MRARVLQQAAAGPGDSYGPGAAPRPFGSRSNPTFLAARRSAARAAGTGSAGIVFLAVIGLDHNVEKAGRFSCSLADEALCRPLFKPCKGFLHNTKDVRRIAKDFEHTQAYEEFSS